MCKLFFCIAEVLRKFPATSRLERVCAKEYRSPDIGLVIPKGALVAIPLNSIHHSKEFYENPDKFDPEHFSPEKKATRNPYAFMPFGMGPRNCIGNVHTIHTYIQCSVVNVYKIKR